MFLGTGIYWTHCVPAFYTLWWLQDIDLCVRAHGGNL